MGLKSKNDSLVDYIPIYLPHKVTVEDVERFLNSKITSEDFKEKLGKYLTEHNEEILKITEKDTAKDFCEEWKTLEPVLSRHLSKSTLQYYRSVLDGSKVVENTFTTIGSYFKY